MKRHNGLTALVLICALPSAVSAQTDREASPRVTRLETWLAAVQQHRPGELDDGVREISTWNQEQLRLIWVDVSTIVSLVREPDVLLFYVSEQTRAGGSSRQVNPLATARSTQVLYTVAELRRLRAIAKQVSPEGIPGPENDVLKRGAMLHADVELLTPRQTRPRASGSRPGPSGSTLYMDDGQQLGLADTLSHWNVGRRLLDRVRPVDSTRALKTKPDPAADDTVRRWYLAGCAVMLRTRFIEIDQYSRALELFPNDPDVLFAVAVAHEYFAGVRMQSVMRSIKAPRDVTFDVLEEGAELRLAEQLYRRALDRNPKLLEARIRLGRVLGRRGRHQEALDQLRQGQAAQETVLQFYAHLFLGAEFEALGNGPEARQSYERAAVLAPTAQSPLLGLSRVADQAGDRAAARDLIARVFALPPFDEDRADPWWVYETVPARNAEALLTDVGQRIARRPE